MGHPKFNPVIQAKKNIEAVFLNQYMLHQGALDNFLKQTFV